MRIVFEKVKTRRLTGPVFVCALLAFGIGSAVWGWLAIGNWVYPVFSLVLMAALIYMYLREKAGRKRLELQHLRTEARIKHMAFYDDMTGLPNRRLFRDRLEAEIENAKQRGTKLGVMCMDIDRFKLVNDSLGHDYGDMLLLQVAERLTHCVRERDFLARMEGDEFAIFYSGFEGSDEIVTFMQNILRSLEAPFQLQEFKIHITASLGVALMTKEMESPETLIKFANVALSRAKDQGKNTYQLYMPNMNGQPMERLKLESELRRAIEHGEFELHYQPQLDLSNGEIVGIESLIRWNHPERGLLMPGSFIGMAEENGMIVSIGEWVLQEACRQNKAWQDKGFPRIPVSVNLSTKQFVHQDLLAKVKDVLDKTGLDPQYLDLELTESIMLDYDWAKSTLLQLEKLGVKISIDDFGTGYSSLFYLKKFPIHQLKIDRSFVRDILVDPNDAAIVTTIIAMAHNLNLKVIAEGVESEDQLRYLNEKQCNVIQGYWFSPPVSADIFEQLMGQERKNWNTPSRRQESKDKDLKRA